MRIGWLSDLHLDECDEAVRDRFFEEVRESPCEVLLISGDIGHAYILTDILERMEKTWRRPTYFVLGNHDYFYSSIENVGRRVRGWCRESHWVKWLADSHVVPLTPQLALVGHDGWADGALGDFESSWREFQDYYLIDELKNVFWEDRLEIMRTLALASADHFTTRLREAFATRSSALALTHVPPYPGPDDASSLRAEWLPHYCNSLLGQALTQLLSTHPSNNLLVLAGHTHRSAEMRVLPNLNCLTAGAESGAPRVFRRLEFGE